MDIDNKLNNYMKVTGIINTTFRPQNMLKKTRIKLYNTLTLPALLYSSENWTIRARYARRITAVQIKYRRNTSGSTWTKYETSIEIVKELHITPVLDKIQEYRRNWL